MKRRRGVCRIRHRRWSAWSYVKTEYEPGVIELDYDTQFRMCGACGAQELRERVKECE